MYPERFCYSDSVNFFNLNKRWVDINEGTMLKT